jgi:SAM-dependent methyltransferase
MIPMQQSEIAPNECIVCRSQTVVAFQTIQSRVYWRCNTCRATFLEPSQMPDRQTEQREYSLHENDPQGTGYQRFLNRLIHPLLRQFDTPMVGLDYGCGPGPAMTELLTDTGHIIHLYDPVFRSDESLLKRTYDFITCTEVVEHFHHPADEFARLDRLLRPGGWLGILTCFQTRDEKFRDWHYRRDPTHVVFYREETMRYLAAHYDWQCQIPEKDVAIFQKT